MERIHIDQLKTGMFVAGVIDNERQLAIKQCGVVHSMEMIHALKSKGILQVVIDTEKEVIQAPKVKEKKAPTNVNKRLSLFKDLSAIKQLFKSASDVQRSLVEKVHDKKALNVDDIEEVVGKLVNAMIDNDEALWFMTRIRKQDAYLLEHSLNVGVMLGLFAKYLGFETSLIHELVLGGVLHDIGKLMIPDKILNKKGKLDSKEYRIMKGHVVLSREIIEAQYKGIPAVSLTTLASHHEKIDGNGYPIGLTEDDIPFFGKMIAIVDVFDAITAKRCYKDEVANIKALAILLQESGKAFDPYLVAQFIKFIGTYPTGTLVAIEDGGFKKLAIIEMKNEQDPLKPKVKAFYNLKSKNYIEIESIDLAAKNCAYKIVKAVTAQEFNIDMEELMQRCF